MSGRWLFCWGRVHLWYLVYLNATDALYEVQLRCYAAYTAYKYNPDVTPTLPRHPCHSKNILELEPNEAKINSATSLHSPSLRSHLKSSTISESFFSFKSNSNGNPFNTFNTTKCLNVNTNSFHFLPQRHIIRFEGIMHSICRYDLSVSLLAAAFDRFPRHCSELF